MGSCELPSLVPVRDSSPFKPNHPGFVYQAVVPAWTVPSNWSNHADDLFDALELQQCHLYYDYRNINDRYSTVQAQGCRSSRDRLRVLDLKPVLRHAEFRRSAVLEDGGTFYYINDLDDPIYRIDSPTSVAELFRMIDGLGKYEKLFDIEGIRTTEIPPLICCRRMGFCCPDCVASQKNWRVYI